jgi:hypothetical protein
MHCKALGALVAEHWVSRTTLPLLSTDLSMEQAVCIRDVFLAQIQPLMGRPLGYKAAAITPPAQRDLGLKEPLGGVYLAAMFRPAGGAVIPVTYGARPIVEAKLPFSVSATRLVLRTRSCVPRRSSSRFISRLTCEIEAPRRLAARVKLPASATATNASRPSPLCIHVLIFANWENCFQKKTGLSLCREATSVRSQGGRHL